jgi:hypothetical protein
MRRLLTLLAVLTLIAGYQPAAMAAPREIPSPVYGWTTDNGYATTRLYNTAAATFRMTTVRVVFDEFVKASDYKPTVSRLHQKAYIMGELLDSYYMPQYSTAQYAARTTEYLNVLGQYVDVWEIGNEVNGEWLGSTSSVVAKISAAYDLVKGRGFKTALTLYYNEGCWERSANEMHAWIKNIPERIRNGVDYLWVSYYEQDCNHRRLTQSQWQSTFDRLKVSFPHSKLGFGEIGPNRAGVSEAVQRDFVTRYYSLRITTPGYVGGYFYWWGWSHLVKGTLLPTFNAAIQGY